MLDWRLYPNFSEAEFRCKHTGKAPMHPEFMRRLQTLRTAYGKPLAITSGYRDATHPIERAKASPGAHASGRACDIGVQGAEALRVLQLAIDLGFTGIGVQQKGGGRFIHLDDVPAGPGAARPTIWSY
jgi:zinc D-Ala-D-Ala carboxypeptidase